MCYEGRGDAMCEMVQQCTTAPAEGQGGKQSAGCGSSNMETVERILHNLFRRKKKKLSVGEAERREADKENAEDGGDSAEEPQRVTVKTAGLECSA